MGGSPASEQPLVGELTVLEVVFGIARVDATLVNRSTVPQTVNPVVLSQPILSLVVRDAHGRPVPTIPPAMPRPGDADAKEVLQPGASRTVRYELNMFSPKLPAGTYTVSFLRYPSNAATFEVV